MKKCKNSTPKKGLMLKVIIAGSRDFSNYDLLKEKCDYYLQNQKEIEIVSGVARGADTLGEKYAKEKGFPIKQFRADWFLFGRNAGFQRNIEMSEYADALIAFWDKKSSGTKHMIETAKKKSLPTKVVFY